MDTIRDHLSIAGQLFDNIMRESYEFSERMKKYTDDRIKADTRAL